MPFLTEPEPERGARLEILPGISRIVANNPGPMTFFGTNTWLIDSADGTIVLDPGPEDDPEHIEAILRHTDGKVALIVVSHTHHDHVGAVPALKAATGARTVGFRTSAIDTFQADIKLDHGDTIAGMTALHTPGHRSDHLCFSLPRQDETILFSADHVMSWSTSVVSPPDGNMAHYFNSLKVLLDRDEAAYLPGHGPLLRNPQNLVREMLTHRVLREQSILKKLTEGPTDPAAIVDKLYRGLKPRLHKAAERSVLAHLLKLEEEGKATRDGDVWVSV
ncbi:MAG TPA: MBL fold metallo-hydrolase [Rhodopila sp.]|uniref:MBL fold metallo-hydrolase n=1 Tax=Rhodopila sp. TaxID=2480087 RepID=UPI002C0B37D3|nr:MBL fold metallo-hydrolase [Rhodopila sp.]HVY16471.1 MBL fold metallo-hydrolase [Rhodopila sp.]